ncbi:MAG: hypothetical protein K1W18_07175 [Oscillospiraceae bacterium]
MALEGYKISIYPEKFPEGYFWCIISKDNANCGFGYEDTIDLAFREAKRMCIRLGVII